VKLEKEERSDIERNRKMKQEKEERSDIERNRKMKQDKEERSDIERNRKMKQEKEERSDIERNRKMKREKEERSDIERNRKKLERRKKKSTGYPRYLGESGASQSCVPRPDPDRAAPFPGGADMGRPLKEFLCAPRMGREWSVPSQ